MTTRRLNALLATALLGAVLVFGLGFRAAGPLGAAAEAKPAALPKTLYDAMHYKDQPDQRPDLQPLYMLDDGVLNRSTTPEAGNNAPGAPRAEFAFRRGARAALGVENDIQQSRWKLPPAYNRVPRPVCLDLESAPLVGHDNPPTPGSLDAAADPRDRAAAVEWMCRMIDAMHDEAARHGKKISVGSYMPLLPFARHTHPSDPNYKAWMAAAESDFAPMYKRLDVAYPACEIHSPDLEKWKKDTRAQITVLKRVMPGKPIVPLVPPHYSHYADESIRWDLIPEEKWAEAMDWLMRQPDVAGVVLWGGTKMRDNPDGVERDPFDKVRGYVQSAVRTAKARPGKN
jgi:hypothetical protein